MTFEQWQEFYRRERKRLRARWWIKAARKERAAGNERRAMIAGRTAIKLRREVSEKE